MFVYFDGKAVNVEEITWIDYTNLAPNGYIKVHCKHLDTQFVEGTQAFDLVMRLCPEATEGHAFKSQRGRWAIHNLFGHPLMQLLSWLGLTRLGLKIHDATVPNPITK